MQYPLTSRRQAGTVMILMAAVMAVDLWALTDQLMRVNAIVHQSCNLPEAVCPFVGVPYQSVIGFALLAAIAVFGLYLIVVSRYAEGLDVKKREGFRRAATTLKGDEKRVYGMLVGSGAMFQSDIVDKTGLNKVKISRILDRLEGMGLIERRRRGMANMVVARPAQVQG